MTAGKFGVERAVLALSLASGAVAITYEILWTRQLLNLFGSTTTATAAMLAAFMAGMALGAWAMGRHSDALHRPLVAYAAIELSLAAYGLTFAWIVDGAGGTLPSVVGNTGLAAALPIRLLVNFAILVLPTALMGATMPVLAAAIQSYGGSRPRMLARIYGLNTLGGCAGAFVTGFWLLETLGLARAQFAASGFAALIAFAAYMIGRRQTRLSGTTINLEEIRAKRDPASPPVWVLKAALSLSGFAAIGYEVVWTRILVLVVGSSTYAFSLMLGTYLLGLALGGLWIGRHLDRLKAPGMALRHLQLAVAISALGGVTTFAYLPGFALAGISSLGTSAWGLAAVNVTVAVSLVMAPTFFLGAALPVAACLMQRGPPRRGRELGGAVAWISLGHVFGVLATAFAIVPAFGLQGSIGLLASMNAAAAVVLWLGAGRVQGLAVPAGLVTLMAIGWLLPPWNINIMTSGVYRQAPAYISLLGSWRGLERAFAQYRTLFYREGREAVVAVFERPTLSARPHLVLAIDGKVDASTGADMATQVLSGHLPSVYAPNARRALVVGLASGVTLGSLLRHPLQAVDVLEIEAAVAAASRSFDAYSGAPLDDPRVNLIIEDGRQYLRTTDKRYDIIVSEPSNPWLSSSARLFTREFFWLARERLSTDGIMLQWVPLYGLDKTQFRVLLRTLASVFPEIAVFSAAESDLLIVAGNRPLALTSSALTNLFDRPGVREDLERIGIRTAPELAARLLANRAGIIAATGEGPLNTDDNGLIEFGSPWYVLRDTRDDNLATIARATANSGIAKTLSQAWTERNGSAALGRIARLHLAADRYTVVRGLAQELYARNREIGDLLRGDLAAREGDWETATTIWKSLNTQAAWLRIADWDFQNGKFQIAGENYARAKDRNRSPQATLNYGFTLIAQKRYGEAISILSRLQPGTQSMPGLLAPLFRAYAHDQLGQNRLGEAERLAFAEALDNLRGRLEKEQGQDILDALLAWMNRQRTAFPINLRKELEEALYRRITGPMPNYYRGVRLFWLGAYNDAYYAFEIYLGMLPKNGAVSRAQSLLERARQLNENELKRAI